MDDFIQSNFSQNILNEPQEIQNENLQQLQQNNVDIQNEINHETRIVENLNQYEFVQTESSNIQETNQVQNQTEAQSYVKPKIFSDVRYYIIKSKNETIEQLLDENGADKEYYLTTFITHVIYDKNGEDPNLNPDYSEAKEVFDLTIVTSEWVEKCIQCETLLPIEPFFANNDGRLFSNIKAVNINLPEDLAKQVSSLLTFYGGELLEFESENFENLSQKPTHGFSIEFDSRTENLQNFLNLITPDWILDSINSNQIQNELVYNPKYLKNKNVIDQVQHEKEEISKEPEQTQKINDEIKPSVPSKSITLFTSNTDKNFYLQTHANNFNNENKTENEQNFLTKTESLTLNESSPVNSINVTQVHKPLYTPGFGINIEINHHNGTGQDSTPPKSKPLTPKKSSAKKRNSPDTNLKPNYSLNDSMNEIFDSVINKQNADEKKENDTFGLNTNGLLPLHVDLIRPNQNSLSLNFDLDTDNEPVGNTESILRSEFSESKESNSNLLLNCVFYTKSNEGIYAKECLNDWEKVIVKFNGRVANDINLDDPASFAQITHVICPNRFTKCYKKALETKKKVCTIYWLEDVLQDQTYRSPWLVYHFPLPYELKNGPLKNHIISTHGFNSKEKMFLFQVIWLLNGKYTPYLTYANSFLIAKNLKGIKVEKANTWSIPIVNANWLMELYLGNTYALTKPIEERYKNISTSETYNHFAFEPSLVQDFINLWKNDLPSETPLPFKNVSSNITYASKRQNEERSESANGNKVQKVSLISISWQRPQSSVPCVMFTGIEPAKVAQLQRDVIALGGIIAKQPSQTTFLIVDKIERTAKLLKCISTCENIVTVKWIIDSKLNGKFLEPSEYQVKDEKFEKHYNCCLKESLERAKNRRPLFNGLVFYLSPSVKPSYQDLVDMIKSAGGTVTNDIPTLQMINEPFRDEFKTNLKSKYVIIGSQADLCILKPFIEKKIPIFSEEIVLSGLLIQQLDANLYKFNILQ